MNKFTVTKGDKAEAISIMREAAQWLIDFMFYAIAMLRYYLIALFLCKLLVKVRTIIHHLALINLRRLTRPPQASAANAMDKIVNKKKVYLYHTQFVRQLRDKTKKPCEAKTLQALIILSLYHAIVFSWFLPRTSHVEPL